MWLLGSREGKRIHSFLITGKNVISENLRRNIDTYKMWAVNAA
jgi:hypothetical protein